MLEVSTLLWTNGPSRRPRPQPPTEQVTFRPLATSLTDTISPIQLEGTMTIFPTKVPLCSPKFSFDHLPPSKSGRKVGALPLQSALQVASKLFAQFRCKLFSPTNHGCIAFRPIHTISSRSFFSDMHLTDKSNPDYKGQPFYLGVHISTD